MSEIVEVTDLRRGVTDRTQCARGLIIKSSKDFAVAGEELKAIKAIRGGIEERFWDPIRKAHKAHRAIIAMRDEVAGPLLEAERIIKSKMADWHDIERARLAEEAKVRSEEIRLQEEARRLEEAVVYEENGSPEIANRLLAAPIPEVYVRPEEPTKMRGVSMRSNWKFEVVDKSKMTNAYMEPNPKAIRAIVNAMGDDAVQIVGAGSIRVWQETSVAVGAM